MCVQMQHDESLLSAPFEVCLRLMWKIGLGTIIERILRSDINMK